MLPGGCCESWACPGMKLTLTRTFDATRMTCADLVKSEQTYGQFVEKQDLTPVYVDNAYAWIQANPRKVIYLLSNETTTETLK